MGVVFTDRGFGWSHSACSYRQSLKCPNCGTHFEYYIPDPKNTGERGGQCTNCLVMGTYKTPEDWYEPWYGRDNRDKVSKQPEQEEDDPDWQKVI